MKTLARVILAASLGTAAACGSSTSSNSADLKGSGAPNASAPGAATFGTFGSPGAGACVPQAPSTFYNAICVCDDLAEAGTLKTHAISGGAASVGVNGHSSAGTGANIEGSYLPYEGLQVGGLLQVRDDVTSTGAISGAGVFDVGQDLSVGGAFSFAGALTVDGTLRLAQSGGALVPLHVGQMGPYVAPTATPCGCDAGSLLPIAQEVAAAASANDDAAHGLSPDGASFLGKGDLTLTAGKYYFANVARIGLGTIAVQGAVAIYFDGPTLDVGVGQFSIAPGSSLDIYVSGILANAGAVTLGDPAHPEAFRLFVGGAGSMIATAGEQGYSGLVYAPQADIQFGGATVVNGSVFAKSLSWGGSLDVTYAGGPLSAAPSCPTAPAPRGQPVD